MTASDAPLTVDWMVRQYGFERAEVEDWVANLRFNWPLSVKAIATNSQPHSLIGSQPHIPTDPQTHRLTDPQPHRPTDPQTHRLTDPQTHSPAVVGLLNMSDYRIEEEAETMPLREPALLARLNAQRYIAVFSFIVAPQYRGTRLNADMLLSVMPDLKANYDFVFVPVMHRLKTHQYWQRWGAREFWRDDNCVYYRLPL